MEGRREGEEKGRRGVKEGGGEERMRGRKGEEGMRRGRGEV